MKKKKGCRWLLFLLLFVVTGILLASFAPNDMYAQNATMKQVVFNGEYKIGNEEWKRLEEGETLPAFNGDVILRGSLEIEGMELQEGTRVSFLANHISVAVFHNGEQIYKSDCESVFLPEWKGKNTMPITCGVMRGHLTYVNENMEIRLHNPHKYGNAQAYEDFLNSFCLGGDSVVEYEVAKKTVPFIATGILLMVFAVGMVGVSTGVGFGRKEKNELSIYVGLLYFLAGGYFVLDVQDIQYRMSNVAMSTGLRQICVMFFALTFIRCLLCVVSGLRKKIVGYMLCVVALADTLFIGLAAMNILVIYDTAFWWAYVQGITLLISTVCVLLELLKNKGKYKSFCITAIGLSVLILYEIINAGAGFSQSGRILKNVFCVVWLLHILFTVVFFLRQFYQNRQAEKDNRELEEKLKSSRVVLALSQIRTHFIFNVLNAISGMCKYDPQKADEALLKFSGYLRNNIDFIQNDKTVIFETDLQHLEKYIELEQIRFGDRINFVKDIEQKDFMIPPLVLQPLVENAIKHGLLPKEDGGTIWLSTRREKDCLIIVVEDDGVGFDVTEEIRETSVGISNVKFRLRYMVNGDMYVESKRGEGTKIVITLPDKEEKCV